MVNISKLELVSSQVFAALMGKHFDSSTMTPEKMGAAAEVSIVAAKVLIKKLEQETFPKAKSHSGT